MTASIWNTYEMVGAVTTGVLIGGVPAIAIMMWKRWDGTLELAEAKQWWTKAMSVAATNDRARWAPHYSGNLNAELPHVTGELIAVDHVERCCTAHGDEPCAQDSGFVPPYCCGDCPDRMPALSAQSHEDEQAPAEDDDHAGVWWLPLMVGPKLVARVVGWLIGLAEVAYERLADGVADMTRSWRTRNEVGNGEVEADPFERFRIDDNPRGRSEAHPLTDEEIAAELATLTGEPVDVVIGRRQEHRYLPTGAYPLVKVTGVEGGRHRKPEVAVSAQRDGGE